MSLGLDDPHQAVGSAMTEQKRLKLTTNLMYKDGESRESFERVNGIDIGFTVSSRHSEDDILTSRNRSV